MVQVVLKDVTDIDPNDQNSILEHLDKVVHLLPLASGSSTFSDFSPFLLLVSKYCL